MEYTRGLVMLLPPSPPLWFGGEERITGRRSSTKRAKRVMFNRHERGGRHLSAAFENKKIPFTFRFHLFAIHFESPFPPPPLPHIESFLDFYLMGIVANSNVACSIRWGEMKWRNRVSTLRQLFFESNAQTYALYAWKLICRRVRLKFDLKCIK